MTMRENNPVQNKSYAFAVRIAKMARFVREHQREYDLTRQVLRSGTSIGANVEEAIGGVSRPDFLARMGIAYREARETHYWLRLLRDIELLEAKAADSLLQDCDELLRLLGAIQKGTKENASGIRESVTTYGSSDSVNVLAEP